MHLILLPGNGKYNKEWIDQVRENFQDLFTSTHVLYYDHWFTDEGKNIDLAVEQKKLIEVVQDLDEYVIFAKSMGTVLTIKSIHEKYIEPKKCIFAGHPVNWAKYRDYYVDEWIEGYSTPTLFVQKTTDPVMSYQELKDLLIKHRVQNYELIEVEGNDHEYEDIEALRRMVINFLEI